MKKLSVLLMMTLVLGLTACGTSDTKQEVKEETQTVTEPVTEEEEAATDAVQIQLSNSEILVDGEEISENSEDSVYVANDIIFYLEGQGIEYGEGTAEDEHSQTEADAHTVVHITAPGTYEVSGTLEAGQIFVDLGEDAEDDPNAVVNLILNDADITCTIAPAVFFYNVYECAEETDEENATMDVDTSAAGANLTIADGTSNKIYGSYVAKIFESCELSEDGTEVVDSKKLHKYDGALYSKMSMNIFGNTGSLEIVAENEGLGSEMHLTIHGGDIGIKSGNDGVNTSEDNVSVFTMNGGTLDIAVTGETGEGDGIDSNGWLLINGGNVTASACAISGDAGIDADKGIYINGGTVTASGNMMAEIAGGEQACITLFGNASLKGGKKYEVKDSEENVIMEVSPVNGFTSLVISTEGMAADGNYTLWMDDTQVAQGMAGGGMRGPGMGGGMRPEGEMPEGMEPPEGFEGGERPELPEGAEPPENFDRGERPEMPEGVEIPEGMEPPVKPEEQ